MEEKDLFFIAFTLLLCICIVGGAMHIGISTGTGKQAGYISEVERTGILWRPPQVKLISIVPTYSEKDTVWYFGANEYMASLAERYSANNEKVVVSYHQEIHVWAWAYASNIIIDDIQPINETTKVV